MLKTAALRRFFFARSYLCRMTPVLVIDNYDSFTFNLVHYLEKLGCAVTVVRNDEFDLELCESFNHILLSPGPGIPDEAGLTKAVIRKYAPTKKILGICLGQQAIAEVFGGSISQLPQVFHGVQHFISDVSTDEPLFDGLSIPVAVGRYHSWTVSLPLPESLEVTSSDQTGNAMSIRHTHYNVRAVQFHPESVLTPNGLKMLQNWLTKC